MRQISLTTLTFIFLLCAGLPAIAQNTGWSIGLGLSGSTAVASESFGVQGINFGGIALFGRWQHQRSGWGAMAEFRGGEDHESSTDLEYGQLNLYAAYTWRRDKVENAILVRELARSLVRYRPRSSSTRSIFRRACSSGQAQIFAIPKSR